VDHEQAEDPISLGLLATEYEHGTEPAHKKAGRLAWIYLKHTRFSLPLLMKEVKQDLILFGTSAYTIYKETKSYKWAAMRVLITFGSAFMVTFLIASIARLMGWA
jgi:hypothetical protein